MKMKSLSAEVIQYIGGLTIHQGRHAGQAFEVMPWQRRFLRGALAAGVAESSLTLARGGGKSTLVAAIGCAAVAGPLAQPEAEILIVASSHEQGTVIYRHVLRFLAPGIERGEFRVQDTVNATIITHRQTGTRLMVKGSDPRRLHGAAPSLTIGDEVAQWPPSKIDEMLAALRTAGGKIPDSRLILIGTRPSSETHPFSKALQNADYSQVHAAGADDPPFTRKTWLKANPGLRHLPDLEVQIRREAKAARLDELSLASFRALRLNQGVDDVVMAVLIGMSAWARIEGEAEKTGPVIWGVDAGTSAAMSAISAYWPATGRLECVAAFPVEPSLAERGLRDGVGNLYQKMFDRDELVIRGGRAVDLAGVVTVALARFGRPAAVAADRWRVDELADALDKASVPRAALLERGSGFRDGAEDVRGFRRAVLEDRVVPIPSLLLRSALAEARVVTDAAGNQKLSKQTEGGRRLRARDDAVAASILAVAVGSRRTSRRHPRRPFRMVALQ